MAAAMLSPQNGAVAMPATQASASDFGSMEVTEEQQGESVAAYGAAVYDPWRFSGTPHQMISCAGFAKAHAANTQPFGALGGLSDPDGAAATFTLDTGVTIGGSYGIQSVRLSHARLRAAVPLSWTMHNTADPTLTWPTS
jgi:hypothetical protein